MYGENQNRHRVYHSEGGAVNHKLPLIMPSL